MSITISATFDRNKIDRSKDYEGHLMVSLKSAEEEGFERVPIQATLVLDVSGSMGWSHGQGQCKIDALKETARKIVENLTAKDEISIVTFRDVVEVVVERQKVDNKEHLYSLIAGIRAQGATNFSGGILKGLQQVGPSFKGIKRLMVLTDGCPTCGNANPEELISLVKERDSEATLSFFGFGTDCDTELLASMTKAGGGNYYFIEKTEDVRGVFARELGGLISCRGQNIEIVIDPKDGNEVLEVLSDYTVEDADGKALIKAEDIYVGENKYILIKMRIAKPKGKAKDRPISAARVEITYDDLQGKKSEKISINPKVKFVKEDEADTEPILEVAEQVVLLEAAKAQREAVKLAESGKFDQATLCYTSAVKGLQSMADRGSEEALGAAVAYSGNEHKFHASTYTHSVGLNMSAEASGLMKGRSTSKGFMSHKMSNSSMRDMEKKFEEPLVVESQGVDDPLAVEPQVESTTADPDSNTTQDGTGSGFTKKRSRG